MALGELIARLERDAERRIAAVKAKAAGEAKLLLDEAAQRRAAAQKSSLDAKRAARRVRLDRELAAARRKARAERLDAEQRVLERVFARARELAAGGGLGPEAVKARVQAALRYVEGARAVARCRPELAGPLRELGVEVEVDASMPWGAVVSAQGVRIDETVVGRLERERARLSIALAKEVLR